MHPNGTDTAMEDNGLNFSVLLQPNRYATPFCVYVDGSKTTETTMRVMLNRKF